MNTASVSKSSPISPTSRVSLAFLLGAAGLLGFQAWFFERLQQVGASPLSANLMYMLTRSLTFIAFAFLGILLLRKSRFQVLALTSLLGAIDHMGIKLGWLLWDWKTQSPAWQALLASAQTSTQIGTQATLQATTGATSQIMSAGGVSAQEILLGSTFQLFLTFILSAPILVVLAFFGAELAGAWQRRKSAAHPQPSIRN